MSPSFNAHSATRKHLISQLVFLDEQGHSFEDMYLSGFTAAERKFMEMTLCRYKEKLCALLKDDDSTLNEMLKKVVLIGSNVKVVFEDDGCDESFTLVHPSEIDPDVNRISFLSPIGRQLLCAESNHSLILEIPDGRHPAQVREIKYAYIGGFEND